jgi:hypothetical protein
MEFHNVSSIELAFEAKDLHDFMESTKLIDKINNSKNNKGINNKKFSDILIKCINAFKRTNNKTMEDCELEYIEKLVKSVFYELTGDTIF